MSVPTPSGHRHETDYDRRRLRQWLAGEARADGVTRRRLLTLLAATAAGTALGSPRSARAAGAGIVKPLPPEWFIERGTNAETRWEALHGTGHHVPNEMFFVRNHTATPVLDAGDWRLRLWGSGLRGNPGADRPVEFGYDDLRALPAVTRTAFVECAGNGRSYYTTQQGETVTGTPWTLGAIGVAHWRGVRLADVLRRAGLSPYAVDVQPRGLDAEYVSGGESLGRVRRPLPLAKALDDVLLAYEMNGERLPYDHGYPVRVLVPSWVGIASIKWVGDIEVSAQPLFSPGTPPSTGCSVRPTRRAAARRSPGRRRRAPSSWPTVPRSRQAGGTSCAGGRGRARAPSPGSTSAPMAGRTGALPACTTGPASAPGPAGPSIGGPKDPAPPTCWPVPRTRPAVPSRMSPCPTRRATCSTRWYGIR